MYGQGRGGSRVDVCFFVCVLGEPVIWCVCEGRGEVPGRSATRLIAPSVSRACSSGRSGRSVGTSRERKQQQEKNAFLKTKKSAKTQKTRSVGTLRESKTQREFADRERKRELFSPSVKKHGTCESRPESEASETVHNLHNQSVETRIRGK